MQIGVLAVGRLRAGPERELVDDYLTRAGRSARPLGLTGFAVTEVEDRKGGGKAAEASLLRRALPPGGVSVALDERGCTLTSPQFAGRLAEFRDAGRGPVTFVIGGADGLEAGILADVDQTLSFGKMVWPHMLVRVLQAAQLYRAV